MKYTAKRIALNVGGFLAYIGAPVLPVVKYWGFLTHTDAKTTISSVVVFVLILGLPVLKYVFKKNTLPFDVSKVWLVVCIVAGAFMFIAQQVFVISCFGVGGSMVGSLLFKQADKLKANRETDNNNRELAGAIADAFKEKK